MSKESSHQRTGGPPPLPPRQPSGAHLLLSEDYEHDDLPPPSYESVAAESFGNSYPSLSHNDPRSRSTQSLLPSPSDEQGDRRKLLLVFIHGFMGNETSFQSFPAHVHSLVAALLSETHTVHTKIYPRYRSKKKIDFARDDFSRWLRPHEGPTTDVILLGHSMGGLLCAEVALIPSLADGSLRHRLIGTVNFDVPFLGMHPRVVKVGLASIFSPAPAKSPPNGDETPSVSSMQTGGDYFNDRPSASTSTASIKSPQSMFSPSQLDPNYNPAFKNDVHLPARKGWEGAWYFLNKHSGDLRTATKQLVKSHLEFGGAMADYSGLKVRYTRIRGLEEQSERTRKSVIGSSVAPPRVRFVNYYTSSTGRPKKPKTPTSPEPSMRTPALSISNSEADHKTTDEHDEKSSEEFSPRDDQILETDDDIKEFEAARSHERISMDNLEPAPMSDIGGDSSDVESWVDATENMEIAQPTAHTTEDTAIGTPELERNVNIDMTSPDKSPEVPATSLQTLLPIPDPPAKPEKPPFYADKESRKLAEKEYDRVLKLYFRAVKDREKALRDREKLEKKRERQAVKEGKKAEKEVAKGDKNKEKDRKKTIERKESDHENVLAAEQKDAQKEWKAALNQSWNDDDSTIEPLSKHHSSMQSQSTVPSTQGTRTPGEEQKPFKDRTFCTLPPKDGSGNRDPTWVRVLMKDVDLVEAHCGLFFPDPNDDRYEKLIGDVGERVCQWVGEAEGERVAREFEAQG